MMWKGILKFCLIFLWFWSNFNCQCTGDKKNNKVNSNPPTRKGRCMVTNKKRESYFQAADLSNDFDSGNHVLRSAPVSTLLSCALECLKESDCKSILVKKYHEMNTRIEPYECHLISGRNFHGLTDASTVNELLYFVRKGCN